MVSCLTNIVVDMLAVVFILALFPQANVFCGLILLCVVWAGVVWLRLSTKR